MTALKSILLMRSVTITINRQPKAFDHIHVNDGLDLKLMGNGAVMVSEKGGAEVYRIAPGNVAGYVVLEEQQPQGQQQAKGK